MLRLLRVASGSVAAASRLRVRFIHPTVVALKRVEELSPELLEKRAREKQAKREVKIILDEVHALVSSGKVTCLLT